MGPSELEPSVEMVRRRQASVALEALRDLFHRIPFGSDHSFVLSDGREVWFKPFYEPRNTPEARRAEVEGEVEAGIDVVLPDGHLEFRIYLSGWGGTPAVVETPEAPPS